MDYSVQKIQGDLQTEIWKSLTQAYIVTHLWSPISATEETRDGNSERVLMRCRCCRFELYTCIVFTEDLQTEIEELVMKYEDMSTTTHHTNLEL